LPSPSPPRHGRTSRSWTPAAPPRQSAKAGYGAVVDGKFVKFDKHGSELAMDAIQKSDKKDNLRADVTGEMKNGEIVVSKLEMNK
jgi:hypothetical protein